MNGILLLFFYIVGSVESIGYYSYRYYSYRYYSYRYYSYYYYSYYNYYNYYSGYLSASTKGEVAGIVIGVIFVTCLIIGCSLYWYIRRGRGQSTVISTEPITTITSPAQPVVPPGHRIVYTPDGPVFKNDNNEVLYNTPPPPYEATTQAEQYGKPSNDPVTMHVDSTSTVNLVNNEVRQT